MEQKGKSLFDIFKEASNANEHLTEELLNQTKRIQEWDSSFFNITDQDALFNTIADIVKNKKLSGIKDEKDRIAEQTKTPDQCRVISTQNAVTGEMDCCISMRLASKTQDNIKITLGDKDKDVYIFEYKINDDIYKVVYNVKDKKILSSTFTINPKKTFFEFATEQQGGNFLQTKSDVFIQLEKELLNTDSKYINDLLSCLEKNDFENLYVLLDNSKNKNAPVQPALCKNNNKPNEFIISNFNDHKQISIKKTEDSEVFLITYTTDKEKIEFLYDPKKKTVAQHINQLPENPNNNIENNVQEDLDIIKIFENCKFKKDVIVDDIKKHSDNTIKNENDLIQEFKECNGLEYFKPGTNFITLFQNIKKEWKEKGLTKDIVKDKDNLQNGEVVKTLQKYLQQNIKEGYTVTVKPGNVHEDGCRYELTINKQNVDIYVKFGYIYFMAGNNTAYNDNSAYNKIFFNIDDNGNFTSLKYCINSKNFKELKAEQIVDEQPEVNEPSKDDSEEIKEIPIINNPHLDDSNDGPQVEDNNQPMTSFDNLIKGLGGYEYNDLITADKDAEKNKQEIEDAFKINNCTAFKYFRKDANLKDMFEEIKVALKKQPISNYGKQVIEDSGSGINKALVGIINNYVVDNYKDKITFIYDDDDDDDNEHYIDIFIDGENIETSIYNDNITIFSSIIQPNDKEHYKCLSINKKELYVELDITNDKQISCTYKKLNKAKKEREEKEKNNPIINPNNNPQINNINDPQICDILGKNIIEALEMKDKNGNDLSYEKKAELLNDIFNAQNYPAVKYFNKEKNFFQLTDAINSNLIDKTAGKLIKDGNYIENYLKKLTQQYFVLNDDEEIKFDINSSENSIVFLINGNDMGITWKNGYITIHHSSNETENSITFSHDNGNSGDVCVKIKSDSLQQDINESIHLESVGCHQEPEEVEIPKKTDYGFIDGGIPKINYVIPKKPNPISEPDNGDVELIINNFELKAPECSFLDIFKQAINYDTLKNMPDITKILLKNEYDVFNGGHATKILTMLKKSNDSSQLLQAMIEFKKKYFKNNKFQVSSCGQNNKPYVTFKHKDNNSQVTIEYDKSTQIFTIKYDKISNNMTYEISYDEINNKISSLKINGHDLLKALLENKNNVNNTYNDYYENKYVLYNYIENQIFNQNNKQSDDEENNKDKEFKDLKLFNSSDTLEDKRDLINNIQINFHNPFQTIYTLNEKFKLCIIDNTIIYKDGKEILLHLLQSKYYSDFINNREVNEKFLNTFLCWNIGFTECFNYQGKRYIGSKTDNGAPDSLCIEYDDTKQTLTFGCFDKGVLEKYLGYLVYNTLQNTFNFIAVDPDKKCKLTINKDNDKENTIKSLKQYDNDNKKQTLSFDKNCVYYYDIFDNTTTYYPDGSYAFKKNGEQNTTIYYPNGNIYYGTNKRDGTDEGLLYIPSTKQYFLLTNHKFYFDNNKSPSDIFLKETTTGDYIKKIADNKEEIFNINSEKYIQYQKKNNITYDVEKDINNNLICKKGNYNNMNKIPCNDIEEQKIKQDYNSIKLSLQTAQKYFQNIQQTVKAAELKDNIIKKGCLDNKTHDDILKQYQYVLNDITNALCDVDEISNQIIINNGNILVNLLSNEHKKLFKHIESENIEGYNIKFGHFETKDKKKGYGTYFEKNDDPTQIKFYGNCAILDNYTDNNNYTLRISNYYLPEGHNDIIINVKNGQKTTTYKRGNTAIILENNKIKYIGRIDENENYKQGVRFDNSGEVKNGVFSSNDVLENGILITGKRIVIKKELSKGKINSLEDELKKEKYQKVKDKPDNELTSEHNKNLKKEYENLKQQLENYTKKDNLIIYSYKDNTLKDNDNNDIDFNTLTAYEQQKINSFKEQCIKKEEETHEKDYYLYRKYFKDLQIQVPNYLEPTTDEEKEKISKREKVTDVHLRKPTSLELPDNYEECLQAATKVRGKFKDIVEEFLLDKKIKLGLTPIVFKRTKIERILQLKNGDTLNGFLYDDYDNYFKKNKDNDIYVGKFSNDIYVGKFSYKGKSYYGAYKKNASVLDTGIPSGICIRIDKYDDNDNDKDYKVIVADFDGDNIKSNEAVIFSTKYNIKKAITISYVSNNKGFSTTFNDPHIYYIGSFDKDFNYTYGARYDVDGWYEGTFENNKRSGKQQFFHFYGDEGDFCRCDFKNDVKDGNITYLKSNSIIEGDWKNDNQDKNSDKIMTLYVEDEIMHGVVNQNNLDNDVKYTNCIDIKNGAIYNIEEDRYYIKIENERYLKQPDGKYYSYNTVNKQFTPVNDLNLIKKLDLYNNLYTKPLRKKIDSIVKETVLGKKINANKDFSFQNHLNYLREDKNYENIDKDIKKMALYSQQNTYARIIKNNGDVILNLLTKNETERQNFLNKEIDLKSPFWIKIAKLMNLKNPELKTSPKACMLCDTGKTEGIMLCFNSVSNSITLGYFLFDDKANEYNSEYKFGKNKYDITNGQIDYKIIYNNKSITIKQNSFFLKLNKKIKNKDTYNSKLSYTIAKHTTRLDDNTLRVKDYNKNIVSITNFSDDGKVKKVIIYDKPQKTVVIAEKDETGKIDSNSVIIIKNRKYYKAGNDFNLEKQNYDTTGGVWSNEDIEKIKQNSDKYTKEQIEINEQIKDFYDNYGLKPDELKYLYFDKYFKYFYKTAKIKVRFKGVEDKFFNNDTIKSIYEDKYNNPENQDITKQNKEMFGYTVEDSKQGKKFGRFQFNGCIYYGIYKDEPYTMPDGNCIKIITENNNKYNCIYSKFNTTGETIDDRISMYGNGKICYKHKDKDNTKIVEVENKRISLIKERKNQNGLPQKTFFLNKDDQIYDIEKTTTTTEKQNFATEINNKGLNIKTAEGNNKYDTYYGYLKGSSSSSEVISKEGEGIYYDHENELLIIGTFNGDTIQPENVKVIIKLEVDIKNNLTNNVKYYQPDENFKFGSSHTYGPNELQQKLLKKILKKQQDDYEYILFIIKQFPHQYKKIELPKPKPKQTSFGKIYNRKPKKNPAKEDTILCAVAGDVIQKTPKKPSITFTKITTEQPKPNPNNGIKGFRTKNSNLTRPEQAITPPKKSKTGPKPNNTDTEKKTTTSDHNNILTINNDYNNFNPPYGGWKPVFYEQIFGAAPQPPEPDEQRKERFLQQRLDTYRDELIFDPNKDNIQHIQNDNMDDSRTSISTQDTSRYIDNEYNEKEPTFGVLLIIGITASCITIVLIPLGITLYRDKIKEIEIYHIKKREHDMQNMQVAVISPDEINFKQNHKQIKNKTIQVGIFNQNQPNEINNAINNTLQQNNIELKNKNIKFTNKKITTRTVERKQIKNTNQKLIEQQHINTNDIIQQS